MLAYSGKFQYTDEHGGALSQGPCNLSFDAETCVVTPAGGTPLAFDLGDVDCAVAGEWDLRLTLYTGRTVTLRQFGAAFSDMARRRRSASTKAISPCCRRPRCRINSRIPKFRVAKACCPRPLHNADEPIASFGATVSYPCRPSTRISASSEMDFGAALRARAISVLRSVIKYWSSGAMLG